MTDMQIYKINSLDEADLIREIINLRMLLWSAAKSNGGKLTIFDTDLQKCHGKSVISRANDGINKCVVFEAN